MLLINADIGENTGQDEAILPHIALGNIACGYHASDPQHMLETVRLAIAHNVKISAHPSYNDRKNFGRVSIPHTPEEIFTLVETQVQALQTICQSQQVTLYAIKPHGALYHDMLHQQHVREAIIAVAQQYQLPIVVPASPLNSNQPPIAWDSPILQEVFADRGYAADGTLLPRTQPQSLHKDVETILQQTRLLLEKSTVITADGTTLHFNADTICFHGDHPASVNALSQLHAQD